MHTYLKPFLYKSNKNEAENGGEQEQGEEEAKTTFIQK